MALVTKDFNINITPGEMPPIVHVSEYDIGRAYNVTLIGENGSAFEIPTGTTATVEGTLNGTVGFTTSATISNNQIAFALTESMTAYSGKAWCKIKLTQNSQPIQTCAFILAVDRAGVEAETVIGAPGFQEQINEGIAEYFDNDPPFFTLPSGGQSGQALLSDGEDGAYWGEVQSGSGLTDAIKTALLACFAKVAWIDQNGQTYYDALSDALYAEDEGGGDGGDDEVFDYTDPSVWDFNNTIKDPFVGKQYLDAKTVMDSRMVTKTVNTLETGSYYRISCAAAYEMYMIVCDSSEVCQSTLPLTGRTKNLVFKTGANNNFGVVVITPSTASITDPRSASISLVKETRVQNLDQWELNKAIYTNRTGEPFENVQAPVDARMLLKSFINLEPGRAYQFWCNSPYQIYLIMLDANNNFVKIEGSSSYGSSVAFTNTGNYPKASVAVKTPSTATQADVSAFELYVV